MGTGKDIVMFAPLVANRRDPLSLFSDGSFHAVCFNQHPLSDRMVAVAEEARRFWEVYGRICMVCKQPIEDPDDYFGTGLLTSEADNPLFEFNYHQFHQKHLPRWRRYDDFRRVIRDFQNSAAWDGPRFAFTPSGEISYSYRRTT
jgi:hypothetical protein